MTYGALASTELVTESKFHEAIDQANKEIAALPAEPEAYFNRGQAHAGLGNFAEAAADYERALSLDASASGLDAEAADDGFFFALRSIAVSQKAHPDQAAATLERYRHILPQGRHIEDIKTWVDHVNGVEVVWVRETA